MSSKYYLRAVLVFSLCAWCQGTSKDCGSTGGVLVGVNVTGCAQTAARCILKRNTNASLALTFKALKDTNTLKARAYGIILDVPMPFDLPNPDACKDSGIECPIKAGETYTYVQLFAIESFYPKVKVDVKWELQCDDEQDVVCALIPAQIT